MNLTSILYAIGLIVRCVALRKPLPIRRLLRIVELLNVHRINKNQ
jgi:hypothetical protein